MMVHRHFSFVNLKIEIMCKRKDFLVLVVVVDDDDDDVQVLVFYCPGSCVTAV